MAERRRAFSEGIQVWNYRISAAKTMANVVCANAKIRFIIQAAVAGCRLSLQGPAFANRHIGRWFIYLFF